MSAIDFKRLFRYNIANISTDYGVQFEFDKMMYIGGSTVLNIANRALGNTDNINPCDIDIFIDIRSCKTNAASLNDLLYSIYKSKLYMQYYNNEDTGGSANLLHRYKDTWNDVQQICMNGGSTNCNSSYMGVSHHINYVIKYRNMFDQRCIDIILIDCDMETLISENFDYDFVFNYIDYNGDVYVGNTNAIKNKVGTMQIDMFRKITSSAFSFRKFIERFDKYRQRGFSIRIKHDDDIIVIDNLDDIVLVMCSYLYEWKAYTRITRSMIVHTLTNEIIDIRSLKDVWITSGVCHVLTQYVITRKARRNLMLAICKQ